MSQVIKWLDTKWQALVIGLGLVAGLIWWGQRDAVERYKDKQDEDANHRAKEADNAARDASKLSPADRSRLLGKKGWYRD